MKTVRTHDKIYLFESRHNNQKSILNLLKKKLLGKKNISITKK